MQAPALRRAQSHGPPLVPAGSSPVISSLDELHPSGIAWEREASTQAMRSAPKGKADASVADLTRRFEGASTEDHRGSRDRDRDRDRGERSDRPASFQPSNVIDRTPTTHPDTGRQVAMPPPRPRGEVRTNDQGVTTVHVGVMPRQPPADAPRRSQAARVGGFGEDFTRDGPDRRKGKARDEGERDEAAHLFDVDLRARDRVAGQGQGFAPSEIGSSRADDKEDPRAGSGTAAFGADPGRVTAAPRARRDEPPRSVEPKARPRSRTVNEVSGGDAASQRSQASPSRTQQRQEETREKEDATPRPRRPVVQRAPPAPESPIPVPRSYRSSRAAHTPSPLASGRTSPAGSYASSALPDDRTDGIYTYDYTNASGLKGKSETYVDADGRTTAIRRYPPPPQDETAYGIPASRRVLAVLKQKTSGGVDERRSSRVEAKREQQPLIVGGRQVVQPGRAMSYMDIVGRQKGLEIPQERPLRGMATAPDSAEGKLAAKMTGYVSAASSVASESTRHSSSKDSRERSPANEAAAPRQLSSQKKPYIDPYDRDSRSPSKSRSRTPQPRKVSSEPGMRKRAQGLAKVDEGISVSPSKHLKTSRSATPLKEGRQNPANDEAIEAEAAWARYYQQMEEWANAATAAGYDPAELAAAEGYPLDLDWWGATQAMGGQLESA